jgi:glycine dehydrogenase subunit 2
MNNQTRKKNFHQAKWDEPVIYELSNKGERGILFPEIEQEIEDIVGDGFSKLPTSMIRQKPPNLPEISQMRVLKHYLRLSQQTLGADFNVDIGQGTCTMKYSPKINEKLASSHKLIALHPAQDEDTVQGILEIIYKLDLFLREISGLDKFTFQPGGGGQAILAMASIIFAYHEANDVSEQRDEIITTMFSHPSDAAAPTVKGYKIINIYPNEDGLPDVEALEKAVSNHTAGLLITNPEDTGIFNPKIKEFNRIVHEAGGVCGYDQANANGILGITRAKEADFDLCFFNLHKTFSSPHGCGGPATGALGVIDKFIKYLPVPLVEFDEEKYYFNYSVSNTIGKIRSFYGVVPAILKAYSWIMSLGNVGLKEVSQIAVLNNNYLLKKILEIRGASAPYAKGRHRIEQVRYSWEELYNETGVTTEDITCRMADFGFHMWSSHHPFIVPQPFTLEPTESYSKAEIDEYIAGLKRVVEEAYENPELVKSAPHRSVVHKIDTDSLDDPTKWAITWRAYLKKNQK